MAQNRFDFLCFVFIVLKVYPGNQLCNILNVSNAIDLLRLFWEKLMRYSVFLLVILIKISS